MTTFVERLRAGEIPDDQVEDVLDLEIERWHNTWHEADNGDMHLHTYLGMTWEEYARWVRDPDQITIIKEQP